jgi:hypothetical protein
MKTKIWALLLALILIACIGLSLPLLLPGEPATHARILSDGQVLHVVDLQIDREIRVTTAGGGNNIITVRAGKIAVTEANCPDHYCMERGFCSSGTPIVCLPNGLVIEFEGMQEIDFVVG